MASQASGQLTRREDEIVTLIAQGLDSRRIARRLDIAYYTVRKHRSNILAKLQLSSAAQLAAYATKVAANQIASDRNFSWPGPP